MSRERELQELSAKVNQPAYFDGSTSGDSDCAGPTVWPLAACVILALAAVLGLTSLVAFFVLFLLGGPPRPVELELSETEALVFNTFLCLVFFLQHSGMIRQGYRRWPSKFIPSHYQGAVYTMASGVVLLTLVVFWQESSRTPVSVGGMLRWSLRAVYCIAMLGMVWSILAWAHSMGLASSQFWTVCARHGRHRRRLLFAARTGGSATRCICSAC